MAKKVHHDVSRAQVFEAVSEGDNINFIRNNALQFDAIGATLCIEQGTNQPVIKELKKDGKVVGMVVNMDHKHSIIPTLEHAYGYYPIAPLYPAPERPE